MADIFLSYARDDREKAESLARALQEAGWSVWWDRSILPGTSYEQVIEHELSSASSVVVLWSAAASQSNWVRDEATLAQSRNVLVSALIDDTELPLGFRQQQTANLAAWTGASSDPEFQLLAEGIATLVGAGAGAGAASGDVVSDAQVRASVPVRRAPFLPMTRSTVAGLVIACALIATVVWSAAGRAPVAEAPKADVAGLQTLVVPAGAEATLPREQMTLTVLSGKLERLNAASRMLSLRIRFANHGTRNFDRTYYTELRLLVNGVSLAPTTAPLDQIEASSEREFDYVFEVPATARRAVLRVIRGDETSDIPLDFTATRP
jgi:hypothetical protein